MANEEKILIFVISISHFCCQFDRPLKPVLGRRCVEKATLNDLCLPLLLMRWERTAAVGFKCGITAALLIHKNSSRAPPKKYLEKQTLNKKCLEFNPAWRFVMAFFWKIESFIFRFQLLWNSICLTNPILRNFAGLLFFREFSWILGHYWLERSERSERSDQLTLFWSDLVLLST
jgi:hypothetical protein